MFNKPEKPLDDKDITSSRKIVMLVVLDAALIVGNIAPKKAALVVEHRGDNMEQCERCGGLLLLNHVCDESEAELMTAMKEYAVKANTVFFVEYYLPYEGGISEGIFTTEEKAKAYILKREPNWVPWKHSNVESKNNGYRITPFTLDKGVNE